MADMYHVLLVDDESLILDGLEVIVDWAEYGFNVVGKAESAEEALHMMGNARVDLLVTDIRMSGLNGLDLIARTKVDYPDTLFVILSGYSDFELVRKAATFGIENYLIKPVNRGELSSTLLSAADKLAYSKASASRQVYVKEAIDILRDNVLLRLVTGQISVHEFAEKSAFLQLDLRSSHYTVAIARLIRDDLSGHSLQEAQLLNFAIRNVCADTLGESADDGLRGYVFNDSDEDIVILIEGNAVDTEPSRRLLEAVRHNCRRFLRQELFFSLGQTVERTTDLAGSYTTAKELADYSLVLAKQGVITAEDSLSHKRSLDKTMYDDFAIVQKMMMTADQSALRGLIRDIFDRLGEMGSISPAVVRNVAVELLYAMIQGSNPGRSGRSGTSLELFDQQEFLTDALGRKTLDEVCESVLEAMENMMEHARRKDSLIEEILIYLESHYAGELSLQSLSEQFHMNTAYLGQLFKKETGKLFSVYLNELRIGKAIELMQTTTLKAKEIALSVGYPNPDYFYKIFKKTMGIYPSEYLRGHS